MRIPYLNWIGRHAALGVLLLGLATNLSALFLSWHQPILDQHGFRQTQTIISSYWINAGSGWWAYQTPVLGAPWAIPFEFPLYQWLAALAAKFLPLNLDQIGRLLSEGFFLATLWPLASIARSIDADRRLFYLASGLLLLSPTYVFWSRAVMMESTVLFFSVGFVSTLLAYYRRPTWSLGLCLTAFAVLASCIKITTFVGFAFAGSIVTLRDLYLRRKELSVAVAARHIWPAASIALALLALVFWTRFADDLKRQTILGWVLTSENLHTWNFGTLAQRESPELWWHVVFGRALREGLGGWVPLSVAVIVALVAGRRALLGVGIALVLYIAPFLAFTNLHIVHNYYQYANSIFLVLGVGYTLWLALPKLPLVVAGATLIVIGFELFGFFRYFYPDMTRNMSDMRAIRIASFLRSHIPQDQMFVGFGLQWASDVPYYSERRAMLVPDWDQPKVLETMLTAPNRYTAGMVVGAVVECPNDLANMQDMRAVYLSYMRATTAFMRAATVADCRVFYRDSNAQPGGSANRILSFKDYVPVGGFAALGTFTPGPQSTSWKTCNIERVNGAAFSDSPARIDLSAIDLTGWIVRPQDDSMEYVLRLEGGDGNRSLQAAVNLSVERPDVATAFHQETAMLGFRLQLRRADLSPGLYHIYIAALAEGKAAICDNGRILEVPASSSSRN